MHVYVALVGIDEDDDPQMIDTGLQGTIDPDGDIVIPFQDSMTAEEIARMLTATINREREDRP